MRKQRSPTVVMPPPCCGAGVHGDVFADLAFGADDQPRRLAAIGHRLRRRAERGERIDDRPRADRSCDRSDAHGQAAGSRRRSRPSARPRNRGRSPRPGRSPPPGRPARLESIAAIVEPHGNHGADFGLGDQLAARPSPRRGTTTCSCAARSWSRGTRSCRPAPPACGIWPCRWSGNRPSLRLRSPPMRERCTSAPAVCAMPSIISTPGNTGLPGNGPGTAAR